MRRETTKISCTLVSSAADRKIFKQKNGPQNSISSVESMQAFTVIDVMAGAAGLGGMIWSDQ
ncbi:hypothetical protein EDS67_18980 [candidate division KSB1 bacterium]|nr:MAG: hypothetical protein EDS67_18980 [candidate division KSB1 bacterium]MBC6950260.1 hypothetical protein [candidate division KSB1 bacterium]MCE7945640.1 hypothetical protein [Chlorobi bacterium CHB1]